MKVSPTKLCQWTSNLNWKDHLWVERGIHPTWSIQQLASLLRLPTRASQLMQINCSNGFCNVGLGIGSSSPNSFHPGQWISIKWKQLSFTAALGCIRSSDLKVKGFISQWPEPPNPLCFRDSRQIYFHKDPKHQLFPWSWTGMDKASKDHWVINVSFLCLKNGAGPY